MIGTRIQRYIFWKCVLSLSMVLGIFVVTIMLVDTVEQLRTVGGDVSLSPGGAIQLSAMRLPSLIEQTFPFAILAAAMMTYNQLSKTSELSVIRATGQSAWQFLAPVVFLAVLLGFFSMMVMNPAGAYLSENFESSRAELLQESGQRADLTRENIWLRQGSSEGQIVIHARAVDATGQLFSDVKFLEEGRQYDGRRSTENYAFIRRIDAQQARIVDGFWQLTGIIENTPGNPPVRMDKLAIETDLDPNTLLTRFTSPDTVGFWELPGFIRQTSRAGLDASRFTMRLFGLTSLPILYAAMALIGAIVCLRLSRLGGTSQLVATGAISAVALFFVTQVALSLGSSGAVVPIIAAWSPALCALFIALAVLAYKEDG